MVAITPIGLIVLVVFGIGGIVASIIFISPVWLKIVAAIIWGLVCTFLVSVFM